MSDIEFALNTMYLLFSGALVMWMAAGFTMLEAGLVRSKNVSEIVTKNIGLYSIACIMYLICGFYIMYPGDSAVNAYIPDFSFKYLGLTMGGQDKSYGSYAEASDFFFQVVFVATAMSIISGAVAERMKIWAFFAFAVVMTGFIYPMEGSWTWNGADVFGLYNLGELGFSDFAGSGIVHMAGAAAALAGVLLLGARTGKYGPNGEVNAIGGANMPLATLGVFILWLGWFGFNGGSELVVSSEAAAIAVSQVFLNTNIAAAGGVVATLITSQIVTKKMDITMAMNGAIAGLVAITAAPSAPTAGAALMIGAVGGVIVYFSLIILDRRFGIDDPVGAISAHGVVGIWGVMAVVFTGGSLVSQFVGVVAIAGFTYVMSLLTILFIDRFLSLIHI